MHVGIFVCLTIKYRILKADSLLLQFMQGYFYDVADMEAGDRSQ